MPTDFRPATDLQDPANAIEDLRARIRAQDELIERQARMIMHLEGNPGKSTPSPTSASPVDQKILQELKDLAQAQKEELKTIKEFIDTKYVKQQAIIDKLTEDNKRLQKEIHSAKDLAKDAISELKEDRKFDNNRVNELAENVDNIVDKINEHAESINKVWQAAKKSPGQPRGEKTLKRIDELETILKSGPRTYQEIERLLKITPKEMNRLVSKLDMRRFKVAVRPGDDRQKVIRLKSWNSLTSNVNNLSGGVGKGP